jgi:hypothetical protein
MAVIVRESRVVGGQLRAGIKVYKSQRFVTAESRAQADRLDAELAASMTRITEQLRASGALQLKGRPGVVRLWWELGRYLQDLVPRLDVGREDDRPFLWRAIYDHAPELVPGKIGARADRLTNSHFYYCFQLGQFEWETVESFGDWTSWVEFFDSERIRNDPRIAEWLGSRIARPPSEKWADLMRGNRMAWFRRLAKAIRTEFDRRDTTAMTRGELEQELDDLVGRIMG